LAALALAAGAAGTLIGCGGADPGRSADGDPAAAGRRAARVRGEGVELARRVEQAQHELIRRCMSRRGFTAHPVLPSAFPTADEAGAAGGSGGDGSPYREPPEPERARADGYGIDIGRPPPATPETAPAGADAAFLALPAVERDRYLAALGAPSARQLPGGGAVETRRGGCEEEVLTAVYGDPGRYWTLVSVVFDQPTKVRAATDGDPRVTAAIASWSACMRDAGHPELASPDDAERTATGYYWPRGGPALPVEEAKRREVALAIADAGCSARTRMDATRQAVWRERDAQYLRAHEAELVAWRDLARAGLTAAQRLLAG
jgi:hypothetical protein